MKTSKVDKIQLKRQKNTAERTCAACRRVAVKRELVRLVNSNGSIEVDLKGKKAGRGIYLCPNRKCWETGLKGNRIEFGLRTKLSTENRQSLLEYGISLSEKEDN
jgi:predicted RNA-binding protein YlxR (DUF448 family)